MDVQVLQENLVKVVSLASRFASSRAQLPILSNILLSAKGNKLEISATNLETSICIPLGAKVSKEGEITVPARTLSDLVSNLNSGQVDLSAEKEQLKIVSQGFSSKIMGVTASDYPDIPKRITKEDFLIKGKTLREALGKTLFAVSTDETRPILTGVYFIFEKGSLVIVATDGFRLSYKKNNFEVSGEPKKFVLPRSVLTEIVKLTEEEGDTRILYDEKDNQVLFGVAGGVLSSRVLQGEYPNFEKIIPKSTQTKVTTDKAELLKAVKLAAVFARDSANVVKLKVLKDSVLVTAESSKSGTQEGRVDAKVEGEGLEIAYNYRFIEDFIGSVEGDILEIGLNDAGSPAIFKDPSDKSYFHLIMPVKI
jgi:DNA polymerase III subunit beta